MRSSRLYHTPAQSQLDQEDARQPQISRESRPMWTSGHAHDGSDHIPALMADGLVRRHRGNCGESQRRDFRHVKEMSLFLPPCHGHSASSPTTPLSSMAGNLQKADLDLIGVRRCHQSSEFTSLRVPSKPTCLLVRGMPRGPARPFSPAGPNGFQFITRRAGRISPLPPLLLPPPPP